MEGGLRGLLPPFQISKIKESNKTKQKIEDRHPDRGRSRLEHSPSMRNVGCLNPGRSLNPDLLRKNR